MVTLRYQLEVSSKTAPSLDVNFGWIRRFRVDGGQTRNGQTRSYCLVNIARKAELGWHPVAG
jgi:hypothetical protein